MATLNTLSNRDCESPMKELLLQFYLNDNDQHSPVSATKGGHFSDFQEGSRVKTSVKTSEVGDTASYLCSEDESPPAAPRFWGENARLVSPRESALGTSASQSLESARSDATVVEQLGAQRQGFSDFSELRSRISERLKRLGAEAKAEAEHEDMHSALDASKLKLLSCHFPVDNDKDDNESIMTEDFVNKFNELVPKDDSGISSVRTRLDSASTKRSRPFDLGKNGDMLSDLPSDPTPRFKPMKAPRSREPIFANDSDSMVTEDFESNFRHLLFKGPPMSGDDTARESSEINTARSSRLRERVSNLFHVPPTRVKLGDDSHSDSETDYVNKKFNEIMDRRRKESTLTRSQSIPASPKLSNLRRSAPLESHVTNTRASPRPKVEITKALSTSADPKDDEYRTEIRLNSLRIKRELEKERKSREASPKRTLPLESARKVTTLTPRQTLDRKVEEIDELTDVVKRARGERDTLLTGLREMQDTLRKNAAEVRFTEKWVKENRMKAEDVRQELLVAEMKRERTSKEVVRLNDECVRKRMEVAEVEAQLRQRVREVRDLERQGIHREELEAVIDERNELLHIIRANEETEYQKYELEKLLTMAREDLVSEQQKNREKHIILEEELDASMAKITDMRREKESMRCEVGDLRLELQRLQGVLSQTEQEKEKLQEEFNDLGRNKAEEFERVRGQLENDMAEIRGRQSQEEAELHRELRQSQEAVVRLTRDLEAANVAANEFRREVAQLSSELATASEQKVRLLGETDRKLRDFEREKREEIEAVRVEMKEQTRAELQNEMDRDRQLAIQSLEDQYCREIEEFKVQLKIKDEELQFLEERVHRAEAERRRVAEESQVALREHLREAVARERQNWEQKEEKRWRAQLTSLKENAKKTIEQLERTVVKQDETIQGQNTQISELRKVVEEERNRVKAMTKERQDAITRVKELAAEERARDVEKMRERLAKETEHELQKLRTQVQAHRESLESVMHDRKIQEQKEEDLKVVAERIERTVVSEINEECRKMAEVLGIHARHVDITEFAAQNKGAAQSSNPVTASLANMEACGEELRSLLLEMRASNEESRRRLAAIAKEREAELEALREQLVTARGEIVLRGQRIRVAGAAEVQRLQAQLQEREEELRRLRRSMQKWKSETAEEIAANIQTEFNRVGQRKIKDLQASLLEREHEIQRLQTSKSKQSTSSSPDPSAARLIGHLQEQVKGLRRENLLLHKRGLARHTGSTGDLSNGHLEEATHSRPGSRGSLRKIATNV